MTFSTWLAYLDARFRGEKGQTMAEYGVVLAVICVATVGVFTALSGGVSKSLNAVVGLLP